MTQSDARNQPSAAWDGLLPLRLPKPPSFLLLLLKTQGLDRWALACDLGKTYSKGIITWEAQLKVMFTLSFTANVYWIVLCAELGKLGASGNTEMVGGVYSPISGETEKREKKINGEITMLTLQMNKKGAWPAKGFILKGSFYSEIMIYNHQKGEKKHRTRKQNILVWVQIRWACQSRPLSWGWASFFHLHRLVRNN